MAAINVKIVRRSDQLRFSNLLFDSLAISTLIWGAICEISDEAIGHAEVEEKIKQLCNANSIPFEIMDNERL